MLNFKMRLYPTAAQEKRLEEVLEINRFLYNYFVQHDFRDRNDMNYALTELKEQYPMLKGYYGKMLQMVSTRVAAANSALNALKKKGRKSGKMGLRLLESGECKSFVYNQKGYRIEQLGEGNKHLLHLSKLGSIELRVHRPIQDIAQITVSKQAGRWYALAVCRLSKRQHCTTRFEKVVALDPGVQHYLLDSEGNKVDNPLFMKKSIRPYRRAKRRVLRRSNGSNNHQKALTRLQRLYMRIANRRSDFVHKLSDTYSKRYDVIFMERLRLNNVSRSGTLPRRILDSSWNKFKHALLYKANRVVEVGALRTTVECGRCKRKVPKALAIRMHACDRCGFLLESDHDSSMAIEAKGRSLLELPMQHREVTPGETSRAVKEPGKGPRQRRVDS